MKKTVFLLLSLITIVAYSQNNSLSTVNMVKPKNGQKLAFEAAYKQHIAKYHETIEKTNVYEILSGQYYGYYLLVAGGRSFADFDNVRADAAAHIMDIDKNISPLFQESTNSTYRFIDSLSIHPDVVADKFVVNVRHIKPSLLEDYRKEVARGPKVDVSLKGAFWDNLSVNVFQQLWAGTDPVIVSVRNLKDGFKSLETDYYGKMPPGGTFKDEYIKQYGTADWDKREKLLEDAVVKNEQYILRLRKDLSSQ